MKSEINSYIKDIYRWVLHCRQYCVIDLVSSLVWIGYVPSLYSIHSVSLPPSLSLHLPLPLPLLLSEVLMQLY